MQGIKNIIFDLGGVIINLDNQRTEDAFTSLGVKDIRNYFGHGYASAFFKEYEIGMLTDKEFIEAIRNLINLDIPDQAIIDSWNALLLDFPPERIQLLKQLRKRYRTFLFSNTNALHLAALQQTFSKTFGPGTSLEDHFEKTYYSHVMGMRKPDRASFEYILKENKLDPAETMFVDDAIVNVEGAEQAGLRGLFLRPGVTLLDFQW